MTSTFQVTILILSRKVRWLIETWMNSKKSRKQKLFLMTLQTSHNKSHIGLWFTDNVSHWLKFKARSHFIFFSWTFDLLLINSIRCLLFGFYFSLHQRSWKNSHKIKTKRYAFSLLSDTDAEKSLFFYVEVKIPYQQF